MASYNNGSGIDKFDGTTVTNYSFGDGILNVDVRNSNAITEDSNGVLYFGTNFGVAIFDGNEWTTIALSDGLPGEFVRSIIEDTEGNLWISSFLDLETVFLSKYNPTLGVFETLKQPFTVFPNPADDQLHIVSQADIARIEVYSLLGHKVLEEKVPSNAVVDVSVLASGAYLLKVIDKTNAVGFEKIIID